MDTKDVVVTGLGLVSRYGASVESLWNGLKEEPKPVAFADYSLLNFKAQGHISDRRMLKAISQVDAVGLAAFEEATKAAGFRQGDFNPERIGVYVGAPPASSFDNSYYMDSQAQANDATGKPSVKEFGKTCMASKPTTLLVGLPNNVLCYGAMVLDARGPNSNYTSGDTSGQIALLNACRRVAREKIDFAVAGGFCCHTEAVNTGMFRKLGVTTASLGDTDVVTTPYANTVGNGKAGAIASDGACFVTVETRESARKRGAKPIVSIRGGRLTSDAEGPIAGDGSALVTAVKGAMEEAGIQPTQIGLVMLSGSGHGPTDDAELAMLSTVFGRLTERPAVGVLSRHLGHLMEAGGLVEIAVAARAFDEGQIPSTISLGLPTDQYGINVDSDKPYALIVRASAWGEYSALIVRKEASA